MKLKRNKGISVFFLVSFFISISCNICFASIISPSRTSAIHTNDHLHLKESLITSNINDLLFEENENENENEVEFDLSLILIPFFLKTCSFQATQQFFVSSSRVVIPKDKPIYIQVSNFRI